ncbi:MAG TPA: glycosyltransferase family 4 protein [Pyrinomonadaceae bacterium]|nr:glycosyltransferase family 4 protein [Pyrinomonadaceae bacterium]
MKVILVVLSGSSQAQQRLQELFPEASIETLPRGAIENGSFLTRLRMLRGHAPDIFAVATERLAWQRGQNLFMLFGAMAGAREVLLIDAHGGLRREPRTPLLLKGPGRLARESILSAKVMARARRELATVERNVENYSPSKVLAKKEDQSPTRIVYLRATPGPGTQAGGASSHIKGVVDGLIKLQAQVEIISNDALAGLDENKLKLTVKPPEPLGVTRAVFDVHNNAVFTRGVLNQIQARVPDFIYQRYARFSWAGVVAHLQTNCPLFLEYNGSEVWAGKHWDRVKMLDLLERYERLNLAAATRIFVVSQVERNNLERSGVAPEKIIVNPNGVDANIFRPHVGGAAKRSELGIRPDEQLVGFVGTFGPWHGVLVLAQAIKLIPQDAAVRFLLVGSGALHGEMRELLAAEEEAGRVIFYGGVPHDQVPLLLDACDVLVSPHVPLAEGAEFFGSPTKLFEYMAMGKGIVASRLGQIAEVLSDEQTALLVEPGNAEELSAAIIRLIKTPSLRESLGSAARLKAIASHTWLRNAQNILDAYSTWRDEMANI